MKRARRGYVLVEALAAGAVLGLAIAGLLSGLSQAGGHVGRAQADREASHRAQAEVERLRGLPLTDAAWTVGPAVACPATTPPLPTGWSCTVGVTAVNDAAVSIPGTPAISYPLTYRRARVTLSYRGRQWSLDVIR
jgi:type II secretory pathway pseudopilin PulG